MALAATMRRWLKPNGTAILVCSRRQGSLDRFVEYSRGVFTVNESMDYDAEVSHGR